MQVTNVGDIKDLIKASKINKNAKLIFTKISISTQDDVENKRKVSFGY